MSPRIDYLAETRRYNLRNVKGESHRGNCQMSWSMYALRRNHCLQSPPNTTTYICEHDSTHRYIEAIGLALQIVLSPHVK